jgi:DNA processing protein
MAKRIFEEALAAIELSRLPGVGAKVFRNLLEESGSPILALVKYKKESNISLLPQFSQKKSPTKRGIAFVKNFLEDGGKVLFYSGPGYPPLLAAISEPPPVLFLRGEIPSSPMAAVVGSRKASADAVGLAQEATRKLIGRGFAIVSGGALGIDTTAHETALSLGIPTLAVLGCGIDIPYPPQNRSLFDRITKNGGILSELLPDAPPRRGFFPTRNRILAGLAEIVVVVQAGEKSGALITANYAKRFNKKLYTFLPPERDVAWAGNFKLLESGVPLFS